MINDGDVKFRRRGESRRYAFRSATCLTASCWSPDMLRHEDGTTSWGCSHRAQKGCPGYLDIVHIESNRDKRKKEGWIRHD
jgi:hypothetical protein